MIEHRRLTAGPYRMYAATAGVGRAGTPIVLVHGLGVSHRYLLPLQRELAPTHEVHAVDLPGFGLSLDPPHRAGMRELADALHAWLDASGIDRPLLVGNSLGCQHITEVATSRDVAGLVLVGPTVDRGARTWREQIAGLVSDIPREPLVRLLRAVAPAYLRAGPLRMARLFAEALDDDLEALLPDVTAPVLVVRGERDPLSAAPWCRHLAEVARDGTAVEIPGAAHAAHFSHPGEVAVVTRRFLARIRV